MRTTLSLLAALFVVGCSAPATSPAECQAIVDRCHELDPGSGPIHDCHEYAEASGRTPAECTARQTECFATCVASDAASDTGADAAAE